MSYFPKLTDFDSTVKKNRPKIQYPSPKRSMRYNAMNVTHVLSINENASM